MHFSTRFCSAKLGVLLGGENRSTGLRAVPGKCVGQMAIRVGLIEHFYFCGFSKMNWQARSKVVTHRLQAPDLELLSWNILLSCEIYLWNVTTELSIPIVAVAVVTVVSTKHLLCAWVCWWSSKTDSLCTYSVMHVSVLPCFRWGHGCSRRFSNLRTDTKMLRMVLSSESRTCARLFLLLNMMLPIQLKESQSL